MPDGQRKTYVVMSEPMTDGAREIFESFQESELVDVNTKDSFGSCVSFLDLNLPCLGVFSINSADQIIPLVTALTEIKQAMKQGRAKIVVFSKIKNEQLTTVLETLNVAEFLEEPQPSRKVKFKIDLQIKAVEAVRKREEQEKANAQEFRLSQGGEKTDDSDQQVSSTGNAERTGDSDRDGYGSGSGSETAVDESSGELRLQSSGNNQEPGDREYKISDESFEKDAYRASNATEHFVSFDELGSDSFIWQRMGDFYVYMAGAADYRPFDSLAELMPLYIFESSFAPEHKKDGFVFLDRKPVCIDTEAELPEQVKQRLIDHNDRIREAADQHEKQRKRAEEIAKMHEQIRRQREALYEEYESLEPDEEADGETNNETDAAADAQAQSAVEQPAGTGVLPEDAVETRADAVEQISDGKKPANEHDSRGETEPEREAADCSTDDVEAAETDRPETEAAATEQAAVKEKSTAEVADADAAETNKDALSAVNDAIPEKEEAGEDDNRPAAEESAGEVAAEPAAVSDRDNDDAVDYSEQFDNQDADQRNRDVSEPMAEEAVRPIVEGPDDTTAKDKAEIQNEEPSDRDTKRSARVEPESAEQTLGRIAEQIENRSENTERFFKKQKRKARARRDGDGTLSVPIKSMPKNLGRDLKNENGMPVAEDWLRRTLPLRLAVADAIHVPQNLNNRASQFSLLIAEDIGGCRVSLMNCIAENAGEVLGCSDEKYLQGELVKARKMNKGKNGFTCLIQPIQFETEGRVLGYIYAERLMQRKSFDSLEQAYLSSLAEVIAPYWQSTVKAVVKNRKAAA